MVTESQAHKRQRILIVEDDFSVRGMYSQLFRSHGYEVFEESDGASGLQKILSLRPDLIIMDLQLPGLMGTDLCAKVKSDPRIKDIPVIMLTGVLKGTNDKVQGLGVGADDYIIKPCDLTILVARVQALLKKR